MIEAALAKVRSSETAAAESGRCIVARDGVLREAARREAFEGRGIEAGL